MNHLLAKTKGKKGSFYKVLSNKTIFSTPNDLKNAKAYDAKYKLEDDEWSSVTKFSKEEYCIDFLKKKFVSAEYIQIPVDEYYHVEFLASVQESKIYFQKMLSSQLLEKNWFSIGHSPKLVVGKPIIVINNSADAVYDKTADILYFRKLTSISTIFKGIEVLYREATDKETEDFLKSDFITLEDGYNAESVKSMNRKRIAIAMETLNKLPPNEKKNMVSYIHDYCPKVNFKNESFEIKTEDDLKDVLFGIDQRYYTTPFGHEKLLANSVTPVKQ